MIFDFQNLVSFVALTKDANQLPNQCEGHVLVLCVPSNRALSSSHRYKGVSWQKPFWILHQSAAVSSHRIHEETTKEIPQTATETSSRTRILLSAWLSIQILELHSMKTWLLFQWMEHWSCGKCLETKRWEKEFLTQLASIQAGISQTYGNWDFQSLIRYKCKMKEKST